MPDLLPNDPHAGQPVRTAGAPVDEAVLVLILMHGRGALAEDMLGLARAIAPEAESSRIAVCAPQAARRTWYPASFLAPLEANEPWLTSALDGVGRVVTDAMEAGVPRERIVLGGFSQGACLASEFAARHASSGRWGGLLALSGGLIGSAQGKGSPPADKHFDYSGSLDGTPMLLGCSDVDPHIPLTRVETTAEVMTGLGARVDKRIYRGFGHAVNEDEVEAARTMLDALSGGGAPDPR